MSHPPNNELSQVKGQSAMIAQHMIYHLLREQGIRLNGYTAGNGHSTHIRISRERSVREAIATLETSCAEMRHKYIREIEGLVNTLDISETQVYPSFLESCTKLMDDDIRWGRIAVLFFFSSVLAERLHREGQVAKIESLVGWLTTFIDDNLSQWILEHGGWVSVRVLLLMRVYPCGLVSGSNKVVITLDLVLRSMYGVHVGLHACLSTQVLTWLV